MQGRSGTQTLVSFMLLPKHAKMFVTTIVITGPMCTYHCRNNIIILCTRISFSCLLAMHTHCMPVHTLRSMRGVGRVEEHTGITCLA